MIRFIHCVKAKPELTAAEFRDYFKSKDLARQIDTLALLTGSSDCKLSLTLQVEANNSLLQSRGGAAPFDALIEVWWENGRELMQLTQSEEFNELMRQMEDYQRQFVDFSNSSRFFVEE
ncbi:MAG: hypothetical protein GY792_32070 [Gammaproteobacteria bacterium]|nr:hypothetical protein [Gammaproteobacteria bacterium]